LAGIAQIPGSRDVRNAGTRNHDFIGAENPLG
jgi:hypothetical protein